MKTIKLELTEREVQLVLDALGELPAKVSMLLIGNITKQAISQIGQNKEEKTKSKEPEI